MFVGVGVGIIGWVGERKVGGESLLWFIGGGGREEGEVIVGRELEMIGELVLEERRGVKSYSYFICFFGWSVSKVFWIV